MGLGGKVLKETDFFFWGGGGADKSILKYLDTYIIQYEAKQEI